MTAGILDINIEQGSTFSIGLTFTNSNGTALDVSLWEFEAQIRTTYESSVILGSFTFTAGASVDQVSMSLTSTETALLPALPTQSYKITDSPYAYDVFATLPDTSVMKILQGTVNLIPRVTR